LVCITRRIFFRKVSQKDFSMTKTIKTKALVLNSIKWKESSKIVTLYSAGLGKTKVIARGAYKNNSVFSGKLESLQYLEAVILVKESRSLQILKEVELINAFNLIRTDLRRFPFGLSIIEIINQAFEDADSDEIFFDFVIEMILALSEIKSPSTVLLYFLLKLSSYLGFKPNFQNCASGDLTKCAGKVFLSMDKGQIFCQNCPATFSNPISLKKNQFFFLKNLQNQNHRRIRRLELDSSDAVSIIQRLITYINFHLENNIHIESLQLLS
jgi:DNA repair protein RecO (recombination protein O)